MESASKTTRHPDAVLTAAEIVKNVVKRLLKFEWDESKEIVKNALSHMLLKAEGCLLKQNKEHRVVATSLMGELEELEKPWRILLKSPEVPPHGIDDQMSDPSSYKDWQTPTIQWLSNPAFFSPMNLPVMKVPGTTSGGVYDSVDDYMDTVHRLWVAMTFADGFATLAPTCRSKGAPGMSCQNALWPVANESGNLRCRTRNCGGVVKFSCRVKNHDAVCGECASLEFDRNRGCPGPQASTHIYDGCVSHVDADGLMKVSKFKSRNAPPHPIHWRSTKSLSSPNLVGIVKLSSGKALKLSDSIKWGEIVFDGRPHEEAHRRQDGHISINMASIVDFDHDYFDVAPLLLSSTV